MKKFFTWYSEKVTNKPKQVLLVGILVSLIIIVVGFSFGGALSTKTMSVGSTPADKAAKIVTKHFGSESSGAQAQIVLKAKNKLSSTSNQKIQNEIESRASKIKNVKIVMSPVMLKNYAQGQKVGYFTVIFKNKTITTKQTNQLKEIARKFGSSQLEVELSGVSSQIEVSELPEIIGIIIAFIILTVTFGSFIMAGVPILSAILGLVTGLGGVFFVTKYFEVQSYDLALAAMVSLAVGIDYALFLVARFKEEIRKNERKQALKNTVTSTAPAVVFAASTIIIALLSMSALGIDFLGVMGAVSALSVLLVVIITLLLVPSLLYLIPIKAKSTDQHKIRPAEFFAKIVHKKPWITIVTMIIFILLVSIPLKNMNLGLPNDGSKQKNTTERRAYDIKQKAYGAGNDAVLVAVTRNKNEKSGVSLTEKITKINGVKTVGQPTPSADGKYLMVSIIPKTEANDNRTKKVVQNVRNIQGKNLNKVMVTGSTAMNIDISNKLLGALPEFLGLITIFTFILLMIAFRSFLIPLVAVLGFVLSLAATLGVIVFTVQEGHFEGLLHLPGKTAILNFLPVLVVGILFGLAMDYEVFLVSRIREEYLKTGDNKQAVYEGVRLSGGSILAAALIMISVFASFSFTDEIIIQMMGLSLAFGVFFDALVIRLILVPSFISVFGKANWYFPKWLDKILPKFNIE